MLGYSTLAPDIYTTLSVDVAGYREPRAAGDRRQVEFGPPCRKGLEMSVRAASKDFGILERRSLSAFSNYCKRCSAGLAESSEHRPSHVMRS